ncbi:MAG: sodium:solute symporter family protein [Gemmatimonadota bacterium]|nr:sodium:solute symporter family protein [Gemmatimonadota bacterium]
MNALVLGIACYVVVQLAIGVILSRRVKTEEDYLVAGRSLGPLLVTFTVFATWFGAETLVGAAGAVYADGMAGGSADPFGYGICILLTGLLFAVPLWRLRLTTIGDLYRRRYGITVERIAVVLFVPGSFLWAAAQIRAFGQVLSAASGLEVEAAIAIAAATAIIYTILGGLLADAWTDLIQGIALIVGLAVLFVAVLSVEGLGPVAALPAGSLNPLGTEPRPLLAIVEEWAIPIVGSVITAELIARILAARSPAVARNGTIVAGLGYTLIGIGPVLLGLIGASVVPGLEHPEQLLTVLAERYLTTVMFVVFAGALISAILSTVDSALLMAAGLVSHNLIVPLRPGLSEHSKVVLARAGVAVFGVVAYVTALRAEAVYDLIEEASAFGSAGLVVVAVLGLFTRYGGPGSAIASLVAGVASWVLGAYVLAWPYPYLTSLAIALAAYAIGAAAGSAPGAEHRLAPTEPA